MKQLPRATALILLLAMALFGGTNAFAQTSPPSTANNGGNKVDFKSSKVLVAYFSHSGNTRTVAEQIQSIVGGDLFEIATIEPYPAEYKQTTDKAKDELEKNHRPALTAKVEAMGSYDVIFIGYPNWWGTMPMPLFTFLEQYDFAGKTIIPFCTHEGSQLGRSVDDLAKLVPAAKIMNGFEIRGSKVDSAKPRLLEWVKGLGFSQ